MSRSRHRAADCPPQEPATDALPSMPRGDEEERRSLEAVAAYLRILQEWSVKDQLEGLGGGPTVVSKAAPKIRKRG